MFDLTPLAAPDAPEPAPEPAPMPEYLERVYWWAYLRPASLAVFDHGAVVSAILWGQYRRLSKSALAEIPHGGRVLQLACVYGDLSERIARRLGPLGRLDIVDAAPIQVRHTRSKLSGFPWARARVADAAAPGGGHYNTVVCFFLLHELPDEHKRRVVDAALARLAPGGRAVFVDYARPARLHPLRPVMAAVFALLEPFAATMWNIPVRALASRAGDYDWSRTTDLGGLYQKVVAVRRGDHARAAARALSGKGGR